MNGDNRPRCSQTGSDGTNIANWNETQFRRRADERGKVMWELASVSDEGDVSSC